jgi:hypothetical protein
MMEMSLYAERRQRVIGEPTIFEQDSPAARTRGAHWPLCIRCWSHGPRSG